MEKPSQRDKVAGSAVSTAPSPRKKVLISLTAAQAEILRALWHEHSAALHAMLTGWCGDAQNASDMLQEVFRRLAESPDVMGRMKNARAFLAVSARRTAVDFARRSNARLAYQTAAGAETPTVQNPGPTDENLRAAINRALDGLPAEQKSVLEHKILNGRTLEEISKLEGVSLNTAASRLRYALDKIRIQLRPYYDDLNRQHFKIMQNDPANHDRNFPKRIITPLEPKRVPSVAPGLEGVAALAADDCSAAVSEIHVPEPEPVAIDHHVEFEAGFDGSHEDINLPETDHGSDASVDEHVGDPAPHDGEQLPMTFEMLPADPTSGAAPEHVDPTTDVTLQTVDLSPEDLVVTLFDGQTDGEHAGQSGDLEPVPFELRSSFEICVLPIPDASTSAGSSSLLFGADHHEHGTEIAHDTSGDGDNAVFMTKGGEISAGGIQPTWRGGVEQPGIAYSMSSGPGLSLSGSSDFGGEMVVGDHEGVSHADGNALTLSNGSTVLLQGGRVVSGDNVYAFNHSQAHAESLPVEVATVPGRAAAEGHNFGDVAAGLAPTPGQSLIVEFGVLSSSESLQAHAEPSAQHAAIDFDLPHVITADVDHGQEDANFHHDLAASADATHNAPPHFAENQHGASHEVPAMHKVDAPTAAAGAVAAGTVVHAGGVAPSVRRPLPKV